MSVSDQVMTETLNLEVSGILNSENLSNELGLVDAGINSVMAAEICALLEYKYDTVIPIETFLENITVNDLLERVNGK